MKRFDQMIAFTSLLRCTEKEQTEFNFTFGNMKNASHDYESKMMTT